MIDLGDNVLSGSEIDGLFEDIPRIWREAKEREKKREKNRITVVDMEQLAGSPFV